MPHHQVLACAASLKPRAFNAMPIIRSRILQGYLLAFIMRVCGKYVHGIKPWVVRAPPRIAVSSQYEIIVLIAPLHAVCMHSSP